MIVSIAMFVLVGFFPVAAGGSIGPLCLVAVFTIPPIVSGSKRDRVVGVMVFAITISAAIMDYRAGRQFQNTIRETLRMRTEIHEGYFPEKVFSEREDLHTFVNEWYSKHLKALQEPSLYKWDSTDTESVFRFTWLRTFHHPVSIRLEILPNGTGKLYSKMTSGTGGYEPGKLKTNNVKNIKKAIVDEFLEIVKDEAFWKLPTRIEDGGMDGSQWIIEGRKGHDYHIVDRWTPEKGTVKRIGIFLIELSNLKVKEIY
ncbi:MAG: hypothetical protein ACYSWO_12980 [Planctomycetota bacterium]